MESNNYSSRTQSKKKLKKITMNAVIVLCVVSLLLGFIIGKAASSNKAAKEAQDTIDKLTFDLNLATTQEAKEIETLKADKADLEIELAEAKNTIEQLSGKKVEEEKAAEEAAAAEAEAPEAVEDTEKTVADTNSSGSPIKTILTIILVIIIVVCGAFAATIFIKRNRDNDESDDYFDEDDYEDEDYDDDEDDEYDDEYDDDEE